MNLKNGKVFTSTFVGTRPLSYEKKNLPGRGLTKVEKHWSGSLCARLAEGLCSSPGIVLELVVFAFKTPSSPFRRLRKVSEGFPWDISCGNDIGTEKDCQRGIFYVRL